MQVALFIPGFCIRIFDYSLMQKPQITRGTNTFGGLLCRFWYSRFEIYQERNPANSERNQGSISPTLYAQLLRQQSCTSNIQT
jgi:hypothetical protein